MNTTSIYTDFDLCYRAICSRDARFDGHFFTAVTSTGIYCRPICPAQTPQAKNVRFYPCAAAAEAAGFRACRRCRPETSPGSPEWNVRADLVARSLRLIAEGVADTEGVAGLARRLAVSERHLHRELVAEVGVGPLALARSRRTQTARLLIDQTDLSLTTIAFTSGFSSIRQFNESMQAAFGCAPSAFRRSTPATVAGNGSLILRLQYRPPFDAESLLTFLGQRALPGVEEVTNGRYRRTIAFSRSRGIIEIEPTAGPHQSHQSRQSHHLLLRLQLDDLHDLSLIVQRCRQLFDLNADPAAIGAVLAADPLLAPLVASRPGLRVPGAINGFELAVRAILGQQVSVAGARTLAGRIVTRLGEPLTTPNGTLTYTFPSPEIVAEANLDGLGITQGRITAIRTLASRVAKGDIVLDTGADREETMACLLALPGVGPWTVSYIAMRVLADPDAFPVTDLGLRNALAARGLATDVRSLTAHAQAWRPWRGYATMHLWASLSDLSTLKNENQENKEHGQVEYQEPTRVLEQFSA